MEEFKIDTTESILRFSIDKNWTTIDFINFFESLNTLYFIEYKINELELLNKKGKSIAEAKLDLVFFMNNNLYENNLRVHKLKIESKGYSDIIGLGKFITQMFEIIKHYVPNSETRIKNKGLEIENEGKIISNKKNKELLEELRLKNEEQRLHNQKLKEKIFYDKLNKCKKLGLTDKEIEIIYNRSTNSIDKIKALNKKNQILYIEKKEQENQ